MTMNPHHNPSQNPATAAAAQQVNPVTNQQTCNGNVGVVFPNNMPIAAPPCFMNFPNQPFPLQNQFPNVIAQFNQQQTFNPFPVNQFNPSQQPQQQPQFFPNNPMSHPVYNQNVGLPNEQVIMQNTIQNICQLLQLQNPNYAQRPPGNFPMFSNQATNVTSHQNPGFLANQQFGMPNFSGPMQHANLGQQLPNMGQQVQGNPFLPHPSASVQTQQSQNLLPTQYNMQNQIPQGVVPQNHNFLPNQLVGMPNTGGPVQHGNQGQQGFVSPMMDVNASRQIPNTGQQGNPCHTGTNFQDKHGNMSPNVKAGWVSPRKNFTGDRRNDASHKGFKSHFHHAKQHGYNGNMNKDGNNNAAVNSSPHNSARIEKKVPSLKYTEQEIKQWREARKKHHPSNVHMSKKEEALSDDVTNQESILRRQQLKEILEKQAELGCEVAEIPSYYLSGPQTQNPRTEKHERERFKKGKFHNKRGTPFQNDRNAKKTRHENQDSRTNNNPNKPYKRDPSLLQKLLTRDIKRDQNHLLQVFRFMAVNSFFSGEPEKSLRFPSVIVSEAGPDVAAEFPTCAVVKGGEKVVEKVGGESEEEGEIID